MQTCDRRFTGDLFTFRVLTDGGFADALLAVDEFVTEASAIAQKVTVHLAVIPVHDAPQHSISFAGADVTAQTTKRADRRRHLHIPLSRVVTLQSGVREHAC